MGGAAGDPVDRNGGQATLQQDGHPGHEVAEGLSHSPAGMPGQVKDDPLELGHGRGVPAPQELGHQMDEVWQRFG